MIVLGILIVMLVGSVIGTFVAPTFLPKIDRTGKVEIFGIRFP